MCFLARSTFRIALANGFSQISGMTYANAGYDGVMGHMDRFIGVILCVTLWVLFWITDILKDIREELKLIREKLDKK